VRLPLAAASPLSAYAPQLQAPPDPATGKGSHSCHGGCGKRVSGNKSKCFDCLAQDALETLQSQGLEADEYEVRRAMRLHT
jgi:hypothetical protein